MMSNSNESSSNTEFWNLKEKCPEEHRPLFESYIANMTKKERKDFSWVVDEIERAVYWETRRELLKNLKEEYDGGGAERLIKHLHYLISKPRPIGKYDTVVTD